MAGGMLIVEIHTDEAEQVEAVLRGLTRTVGVNHVTNLGVDPPQHYACDSNPTRLG